MSKHYTNILIQSKTKMLFLHDFLRMAIFNYGRNIRATHIMQIWRKKMTLVQSTFREYKLMQGNEKILSKVRSTMIALKGRQSGGIDWSRDSPLKVLGENSPNTWIILLTTFSLGPFFSTESASPSFAINKAAILTLLKIKFHLSLFEFDCYACTRVEKLRVAMLDFKGYINCLIKKNW